MSQSEVRDAVARAIFDDLTDRRGIRQAIEGCEADIRREMEETIAGTAISAFLEAIKAQGCQVVPREPADEMRDATAKALCELDMAANRQLGMGGHVSYESYRPRANVAIAAMLAAAPEWKP